MVVFVVPLFNDSFIVFLVMLLMQYMIICTVSYTLLPIVMLFSDVCLRVSCFLFVQRGV